VDDYLIKIGAQIAEFFKEMSVLKRVAFVFTLVGILCIIGVMFMWASNKTFVPIMTNINPEESTAIIRLLREKNIPFRVEANGKTISVPPENLYDFRLELASMGMAQSGVVGYEVFDKQSIGISSFVQKLNQKRAQEGELMRTINSIRGVKRSRVHLAIPQKSTFVEDQKKSTASVVLDLEPGTVLNEKQVFGIVNLVARAVEGMEISDVVIMNSDGKVLSKNASDSIGAATTTQLDLQQKIEADFERRLEEVLSRVVGEGRIVAKVTATVDFSQVNETQTSFDADGSVVRSVERYNDNMLGSRPLAIGAAGAATNNPAQAAAGGNELKTETVKNNEVTNYEIPQIVKKTTHSAGNIKRLSVAVVVDQKVTKTKDKDGKIITKTEAWPAEKLKEFEQIAASTVGLDLKRGDTLEIKNIEFTREDFEESQRIMQEVEKKNYIQNILTYGAISLTVLLFFLLVVRPFIKWITDSTIDSIDTFLPQTVEELERLQKATALPAVEDVVPVIRDSIDPEKVEGEMIKERIITLVDSNPQKAALIIKDWLHRRGPDLKGADGAKGKEKAASA
jgi:flagellar M-ring protein FliF